MRFADITGQEDLKRHLTQSVDAGRVSHAQLFTGKAGSGALAVAVAYVQYLCCRHRRDGDSCGECPDCRQIAALAHPDLHLVFPVNKQGKKSGEAMRSDEFLPQFRTLFAERGGYFSPQDWYDRLDLGKTLKGMIAAREADEIIRKLSFKSFEADYKTMLIWLPEAMNEEAANKILKILEEPWERTLFILVSEQPDRLLPTIISRTQEVAIPRIAPDVLERVAAEKGVSDPLQARNMARLSGGNLLELNHLVAGESDALRKENFDAVTVTTLVIDEFDKCLEFGFHDEMAEVIGQLPSLKKRILLSATDAEEIPQFAGVGGEDQLSADSSRLVKLNFLDPDALAPRLKLHKVVSPEKDKLETLYNLLCVLGYHSTLVFCNYRESVERVTGYLQAKKFPCDMFHGGMEQPDRERALYKFRNGSCAVLISTDLAARGLDIPGIENVVHYHLPVNEEAYTHRNGRTARWEADGNSYLILHDEERVPEYIPEDIEIFEFSEVLPKPAKSRWATLYIGKGKKDKLNKVDIVGFLYKKGGLAREDVGQVDVKEHYAFVAVRRSKMKQLLTLIQGEKIKGVKTIIEEAK